jgi:hypothetical protein
MNGTYEGLPPWLWIYGALLKLWMVSALVGLGYKAWMIWRVKHGLPPTPRQVVWAERCVMRMVDGYFVRQLRKDLRRHRHA